MKNVTVTLKQGRERPVAHGHPWVFSGAIAGVEGAAEVGDVADVVTNRGEWLARGLIHPDAALSVRLYTRQQDQALDLVKAYEVDALSAIEARANEVGPTSGHRAGAARCVEAVVVRDVKRLPKEVVEVLLQPPV